MAGCIYLRWAREKALGREGKGGDGQGERKRWRQRELIRGNQGEANIEERRQPKPPTERRGG